MENYDDDKLMKKFVKVTKRHRLSFLERLEEKYVKTQDQSDIIDLETMTVVKDRGHLKGMKKPKPFGTLSSYNCKPGRKIMHVLKRRITVKNKIKIVQYDEEDQSSDIDENESFLSYDVKGCDAQLSRLNISNETLKVADQLSGMGKKHSFLSYYDIKESPVQLTCLNKSNQTLKVGCGIDPLSFSKRHYKSLSDEIDALGTNFEVKLKRTAHISRYLMDIPICDLSFGRQKYLGNFKKKQKSKCFQKCISAKKNGHTDLNERNIHKTPNMYLQLEQEVEIVEEHHLSSASSDSKKSKKKEETKFHIPFSSKFLLEKSNCNFSNKMSCNPKAVEMDYIYERNLRSRNLVASAIRPLPVPKVYSNLRLKSTKTSTPKNFSNLL